LISSNKVEFAGCTHPASRNPPLLRLLPPAAKKGEPRTLIGPMLDESRGSPWSDGNRIGPPHRNAKASLRPAQLSFSESSETSFEDDASISIKTFASLLAEGR